MSISMDAFTYYSKQDTVLSTDKQNRHKYMGFTMCPDMTSHVKGAEIIFIFIQTLR